MTNTITKCQTCGIDVAIVKGVARDLSRTYGNGARYLRGVHHCDANEVAAEREALSRKDRNARVLARYYGLLQTAVNSGHIDLATAQSKYFDAMERNAQ